MEQIRIWLPIGVSLAFFAWNIWLYRSGARRQQTDKLEARVSGLAAELAEHKEAGQSSRSELSSRLKQVEQTLTQLPDNATVHKLALDVSEMRGDVRVQGEALKAIGATAHRVETFLLEGAKGGQR